MSRRNGPNPLVIIVIGALLVFGGYYVWIGLLNFLENQGDITAVVTREAFASATASSSNPTARPTLFQVFTPSPLPPCLEFEVSVERAIYRKAPCSDDELCPRVDSMTFGTEICVYGRANENPEWFVVELNPGGAFRDIVYMHESVVEATNPTPTPTVTFTPLPTVSPAPSDTPTRTPIPSPTSPPEPTAAETALPDSAPSGGTTIPAAPTVTPAPTGSPTLPRISI